MSWHKGERVLIVGLGNPGARYATTRHNAGFMLADLVADAMGVDVSREKFGALFGSGLGWEQRPFVILKPQTFMNLSGRSVAQAYSFFDLGPERTIVLHDDIDLPWGDLRVKVGGGHGGHNGLRSIMKETGSGDFVRVRIGIARPDRGDVTGHVLGAFNDDEWACAEAVFARGVEAVRVSVTAGPKVAMNQMNGLFKASSRQEELQGD